MALPFDVNSVVRMGASSAAAVPNIAPRKMKGYQPVNCGEPEKEITGLSGREAYGESTRYVEQEPKHNWGPARVMSDKRHDPKSSDST